MYGIYPGSGVASPHYSPTARGSYFEQVCLSNLIMLQLVIFSFVQCFEVIEKIGEGSFGEVGTHTHWCQELQLVTGGGSVLNSSSCSAGVQGAQSR